jgi:flagellar hook-associated protein 2
MALEIPQMMSSNPQLLTAMEKVGKAEQKALQKFDKKIGVEDNKLKLVKELKDKVTKVRDNIKPFTKAQEFMDLTSTSSNPQILTASVDREKAIAGTYEFEVLGLAKTDSVMSNGFKDKDTTQVGVGYLTFKTPEGESRDVYINTSNNTLEGMAKAINEAGIGIKAYVINEGTDSDEPWKLVMSSEKTGWKQDFEYPEINFLDGDFDFDLERQRDAESAIIKFNGNPMMVETNKITDLLPGVAIELKSAKPGEIVTLNVKPDFEKIGEKAKSMVDSLNAVFSFISNQNALTGEKDPSKALGGDVTLQNLEARFRDLVHQSHDEMDTQQIKMLRDVGITFNRQGSLDYDPKKMQAALEKNFQQVASLFVGDGFASGFANKAIKIVDSYTRTGDGTLTTREQGLQKKITGITQEKEKAETRAQARLQKTMEQLGSAEEAIEKMKRFQNGGMAAMMQG